MRRRTVTPVGGRRGRGLAATVLPDGPTGAADNKESSWNSPRCCARWGRRRARRRAGRWSCWSARLVTAGDDERRRLATGDGVLRAAARGVAGPSAPPRVDRARPATRGRARCGRGPRSPSSEPCSWPAAAGRRSSCCPPWPRRHPRCSTRACTSVIVGYIASYVVFTVGWVWTGAALIRARLVPHLAGGSGCGRGRARLRAGTRGLPAAGHQRRRDPAGPPAGRAERPLAPRSSSDRCIRAPSRTLLTGAWVGRTVDPLGHEAAGGRHDPSVDRSSPVRLPPGDAPRRVRQHSERRRDGGRGRGLLRAERRRRRTRRPRTPTPGGTRAGRAATPTPVVAAAGRGRRRGGGGAEPRRAR